MKEQDLTKLEFLMKVNDNIIVQRFFNVRNYNPKAKNSDDLYEYIKDFKDEMCHILKMKTVDYMLQNSYEIMENPEILETSFVDGPEYFSLIIKNNDMTICHRLFDAKIYPPKIRYTVDIRQQVKIVLRDLTDIFSSEELETNYLDYSLV